MIPKGTKVRLRTENGGDTEAWLVEDYRPTFGGRFCYREHQIDGPADHHFGVPAWRITSVEVVA